MGAPGTVSPAEAQAALADQGIRTVLELTGDAIVRANVKSIDDWFHSDLAVPGIATHFADTRHTDRVTRFREMNARRNAIAHNRARVDDEYLRRAGVTTMKVGDALQTDAGYLRGALLDLRLVVACVASVSQRLLGKNSVGGLLQGLGLAHRHG